MIDKTPVIMYNIVAKLREGKFADLRSKEICGRVVLPAVLISQTVVKLLRRHLWKNFSNI